MYMIKSIARTVNQLGPNQAHGPHQTALGILSRVAGHEAAVSANPHEPRPESDGGCIEAFARLVAEAQACRACPRMEGRVRLLGPANGPLRPRLCFVAEAPGRLGGDRTNIPLCGDQSGRNFERLLAAAQLDRASVFVANAVLCNPRDAAGRNAPPSSTEIRHCSRFLAATLDLLQPPYVVALGAVALRALARIELHGATLAADVGAVIPWCGRSLIPLYHPGPRAQLHRPYARQAEDFRKLGALVRVDDGAH